MPKSPVATLDPAATPETLVATLFDLNSQLLKLTAQMDEAKAALIANGKGKYGDGSGRELTVIEATEGTPGTLVISYVLDSEEAEAKARALAGDKFRDIFNRREVFTPCEGFEHVVPKLLTPAKSRDLLTLCKSEKTTGATSPKKGYILGLPKK